MIGAGALTLDEPLAARLEEETGAGRRVVALCRTTSPLPPAASTGHPAGLEPIALVVPARTSGRGRGDPGADAKEDVGPEADLGDAKATVTAVAAAVGIPTDAGDRGSGPAEDEEELVWSSRKNDLRRIRPEQKRQLVSALAESGAYTAMIGDGVNDVPALKSARMAVAMGPAAR